MKRFVLLSVLLFLIVSCSVEDDSPKFHYETVPVDSVVTPEFFDLGSIHDITVRYFRPSGCHVFNNFLFDTNGNEITVVVVNTVYENQECEMFGPEEDEVDVSFSFRVNENQSESYIFKFWQGEDDTGDDLYYVVEVPINVD